MDKKVIELLVAPVASTTTVTTTQEGGAPVADATGAPSLTGEANYSVVSVSQIQYRWGAVLSYRGVLYNVHVGDVLSDGSTVIGISKDSVTLQKNGVRKKVSLVSII